MRLNGLGTLTLCHACIWAKSTLAPLLPHTGTHTHCPLTDPIPSPYLHTQLGRVAALRFDHPHSGSLSAYIWDCLCLSLPLSLYIFNHPSLSLFVYICDPLSLWLYL